MWQCSTHPRTFINGHSASVTIRTCTLQARFIYTSKLHYLSWTLLWTTFGHWVDGESLQDGHLNFVPVPFSLFHLEKSLHRLCAGLVLWRRDYLNSWILLIWSNGCAREDKTNIVWLKILVGIYFGGLLKICHLEEFTLVVEPVLAIMIFITKLLIDCTGNLPGYELVTAQLEETWWWNATEN